MLVIAAMPPVAVCACANSGIAIVMEAISMQNKLKEKYREIFIARFCILFVWSIVTLSVLQSFVSTT